MSGGRDDWGWVLVLECVPAAAFGSAVAFAAAAYAAVTPLSPIPPAAGVAALFLSWFALRRFAGRQEPFPIRYFEQPDIEPQEQLTADDNPVAEELAELLLEDVRVDPDPAERVVRLFQASQMPTAGQLHERIEQHLGRAPRPALPDATQELHEALAALRRSLR